MLALLRTKHTQVFAAGIEREAAPPEPVSDGSLRGDMIQSGLGAGPVLCLTDTPPSPPDAPGPPPRRVLLCFLFLSPLLTPGPGSEQTRHKYQCPACESLLHGLDRDAVLPLNLKPLIHTLFSLPHLASSSSVREAALSLNKAALLPFNTGEGENTPCGPMVAACP